jgi:hypothetical protein
MLGKKSKMRNSELSLSEHVSVRPSTEEMVDESEKRCKLTQQYEMGDERRCKITPQYEIKFSSKELSVVSYSMVIEHRTRHKLSEDYPS